MGVQILRFYLKVFSLFLLFVGYFFYIILVKEIKIKNDYVFIKKNENYKNIIDNNISDNYINKFFYKLILKTFLIIDYNIHFGKFIIKNNSSYLDIIKKINKPSNFYKKITIVEGWSKKDLDIYLKENFKDYFDLQYSEIIADTYFFSEGISFLQFKQQLDDKLLLVKNKFKEHSLSKKYSFDEILIIGSLLEKEGLDIDDKRKIYSVIMNRLKINMKLQIDATVVFSLKKDDSFLDRKLTYKDLKIEDPYNTYIYYGLPPGPISYVGHKTIELIYEDYKTDYLFYFYNSFENKHVFSLNYKDHLNKLNEYRSKK